MVNVPRNVTGNSEQPSGDIRGYKIPKIPRVSNPVHSRTSPQIPTRNAHPNLKKPIQGQHEHQFNGEIRSNCYFFYRFWMPNVPRSLGQGWNVHPSKTYSDRVYFHNENNAQNTWDCPLTEDELIEYFKKQNDRRWEEIEAEQQKRSRNVDPLNLDASVVSTNIETSGVSRHKEKEMLTNYDEEPTRPNPIPSLLNISFDNAHILDREIERNNLQRSYLECMGEDDDDEPYSNNFKRNNNNNNNNVPHTSTQPVLNDVLGQNERWNSNSNGHEKNVRGCIENDEAYPVRDRFNFNPERRDSNLHSSINWKSKNSYVNGESSSTTLKDFNDATDGQNNFEKDIENETSLTNVLIEEERTPEETKSKTSEERMDAKSLDNSLGTMPENDEDEHYEGKKDLRNDGALEEGNGKNNETDAFDKPVLKDLKKNAKNMVVYLESSNSSSDEEETCLTKNQEQVFRTELLPELIKSLCDILTKVIEVGMEKTFEENWKSKCIKQPWEIDDCLMILKNNWIIIAKNVETTTRIEEIRTFFENYGKGNKLIIPEIMVAVHLCKRLLGLLWAEYENLIHPFMKYFRTYKRKVVETLASKEMDAAKKKKDKRRKVVYKEDENKEEDVGIDVDAVNTSLREIEEAERNQNLLEQTSLFMIEDIRSFCENSFLVLNIELNIPVFNEEQNFSLDDVYKKFQYYSSLVDELQDVFERIEASSNEDFDEKNIDVDGFLECIQMFTTEQSSLTVETVREYFSKPIIVRFMLVNNWIPQIKLYKDMLSTISIRLK